MFYPEHREVYHPGDDFDGIFLNGIVRCTFLVRSRIMIFSRKIISKCLIFSVTVYKVKYKTILSVIMYEFC